jgi:hypothetical protein
MKKKETTSPILQESDKPKQKKKKDVTLLSSSKENVIITEETIRQKAYELYLQRNGRPGDAHEDWLHAENLLHNQENKDI